MSQQQWNNPFTFLLHSHQNIAGVSGLKHMFMVQVKFWYARITANAMLESLDTKQQPTRILPYI